jgi:hypothetical protein
MASLCRAHKGGKAIYIPVIYIGAFSDHFLHGFHIAVSGCIYQLVFKVSGMGGYGKHKA